MLLDRAQGLEMGLIMHACGVRGFASSSPPKPRIRTFPVMAMHFSVFVDNHTYYNISSDHYLNAKFSSCDNETFFR